jgi:hypothetical protein
VILIRAFSVDGRGEGSRKKRGKESETMSAGNYLRSK